AAAPTPALRPSSPPSPRPASAPPSPVATVSADDRLADELLSYVPRAWRADCSAGPSLVDGAVADLQCFPRTASVDFVIVIQFGPADLYGANGAYGNNFYADGSPTCPEAKRLDGDLIVGGTVIGTAGGCTNNSWFVFVLDDLGIEGE